jgi:hypothetical protein
MHGLQDVFATPNVFSMSPNQGQKDQQGQAQSCRVHQFPSDADFVLNAMLSLQKERVGLHKERGLAQPFYGFALSGHESPLTREGGGDVGFISVG